MRCSIYFFAVNSADFAARLATPEGLFAEVAHQIRNQSEFDEQYVAEMLRLAADICSGTLPDDCDAGYFDALCWLGETAGEKIQIPELILFRSLSFLEDTGIWPLMLRDQPSVPVPVCSSPPPAAGFRKLETAESGILAEIDALPECESDEAIQARMQFYDVVESVAEDRLDLLAVLLCH